MKATPADMMPGNGHGRPGGSFDALQRNGPPIKGIYLLAPACAGIFAAHRFIIRSCNVFGLRPDSQPAQTQ